MLRHAWKLWTAIVVTYGIGAALEYFDPGGVASYWDEMLMHLVHTFTVMGVGVTAFAYIDRHLLPWLNIRDVAEEADNWENNNGGLILGWFILFAAWLVAWAIAYSGD